MDCNQNSIEELVVALAQDNLDIVILWLYGSRGDGRNSSSSDYDLAVAFRKFPRDDAERQLRPQLLAIDWCKALQLPESKLSIVDINLAPIPLSVNIIDTSQVLLSKDDLRLIKEENRIAGLWRDIQWRNRQQQSR
jgi:predicted nucleotidyltransferase